VTAQPWEELRDLRQAWVEILRGMAAAGILEAQLRLALASPRGRATALRVLRDGSVQQVMDLVDDVFTAAVTPSADTGLARTVLARLDPGWLALTLRGLLAERLDSGSVSAEEQRCIVDLLTELDQPALLAEVTARHAHRPH